MGTDHIRISEEAKARLEARKRPGESFTDVVMRLTDRDDAVERFVGAYDDVDLAGGVADVRERMDRDFRTREGASERETDSEREAGQEQETGSERE